MTIAYGIQLYCEAIIFLLKSLLYFFASFATWREAFALSKAEQRVADAVSDTTMLRNVKMLATKI
jgi:hypothetical protein